MIVNCRKCGVQMVEKQRHNMCRPCYNATQRAYLAARPEARKRYNKQKYERVKATPHLLASERKRGREYWQQLRHEAVMAYGGYVCNCCGETEPLFLTLDHVNNDGAEHRRSIGEYVGNGKGAGSRTLTWLKEKGYPEGFQVLCMNCNLGKQRNKGICPHHASTERKTALIRGTPRPGNPEPSVRKDEGVTTIM